MANFEIDHSKLKDATPELRHLFSIRATLKPSLDGGQTPGGQRILDAVKHGEFKGERLNGSINPGTGDWRLVRSDNTSVVDARIVLLTNDNATIHMSYSGRIVVSPDILGDMRDPEKRYLIDRSKYYFRITPFFETGAEKYLWMNNIVCIGTGRLIKDGVSYDIYEVL